MYKLIYFSILKSNFSTQKVFIRNKKIPICSNCVHFIEYTNNYPYDPIPNNEQYGKCKKFGEVITGVIEYDLANNCRLDDSQCGKFGSEFTNKNVSEV
jgi:hypothetical protein